jgi:hypothetical protein
MAGFRPTGNNGSFTDQFIQPGDTLMFGEIVAVNATVGAAAIPASQMLTGILYRSGSTGAYSDTFDTAANVYTQLSGGADNNNPVMQAGSTFRLRVLSSVAFADTIVLGAGMVAGQGSLVVPASGWREFLFTLVNGTPPQSIAATTINGSPNAIFSLTGSAISISIGPAARALNVMPGASVTGTGIPAGTTVLSVVQGNGGTTGVVLSANATVTGATALSFGPVFKVDSIGSGTA